MHRNGVKERTC